jgi:hypothetical protein
MGEEFEAEKNAKALAEAEREAMPELPDPEGMPRVPEPLGTPKSLGGVAERAGVDIEATEAEEEAEAEGGTIVSLRDRTGDWTEDIEEREEIEQNLVESENEDEADTEAEKKEAE